MSDERLKPCAITPMQQHFDTGCVPTSIAMVLSGFGVETTEKALIDSYFPNAGLPLIDPDSDSGQLNKHIGVQSPDLVRGIVDILQDLGLQEQLRVDVFDSFLYPYASSPAERYIIECTPGALKKYAQSWNWGPDITRFYQTMEALLRNNRIGVYTANAKKMNFSDCWFDILPEYIAKGFFDELTDFVSQGHTIGSHGGLTMHVRVLDGTKTTDTDFWLIDPVGKSYSLYHSDIFRLDAQELRGDTFDYLFRVSPKEKCLNPQQYGIRGFLHNLRQLFPH